MLGILGWGEGGVFGGGLVEGEVEGRVWAACGYSCG